MSPSRFSFVHAADLHLDSPFRAFQADARAAAVLREATFRAFSRVIDLCLRERVAFLVLAGDLFDLKDRSVRARLFLRAQLARLAPAGIEAFIVHGNHDPLSGDRAVLELPAGVHVFGPALGEREVVREGRLLCRVQGVSYPQERVTEDLSRLYARRGPEPTVGLLHGNLGGNAGHANYAPCSVEGLSARGLDYWALGHVHTRAKHVLRDGLAVYPGNPQGRHALETGERGCALVEVDEGRCRPRFVATDAVRWHGLEVGLDGLKTVDALVAAVEERVAAACGEGFDAHAVRLVLTGRGPLHAELAAPEGLAGLEEHLRGVLAARAVPVVLESVDDRSAAALDLAALEALGGLPAQVLREAAVAREHRSALEALLDQDTLASLDAALKRVGLPSVRERSAPLLDRAVDRALSLLVEEAE